MTNKATRHTSYPSSLYVFIVFSLAAFMALFIVWRTPGILYSTQAEIALAGTEVTGPDVIELESLVADLQERCHDTGFVLLALQASGLVGGEVTPQLEKRAALIGQRLGVQLQDLSVGKAAVRLSLETQNPTAAVRLLNEMTRQVGETFDRDLTVEQASVVDQRGGSINAGQLTVLAMLSSITGFLGVWLAARAKPSRVFYSEKEVAEAGGLPVVARLEYGEARRVRDPAASGRRLFQLSLTVAECGIAAVFLLVLFQCVTQHAFLDRLWLDPLAAYGETLSRLAG